MNSVSYYDENADAFFRETVAADMSEARERFLAYLPEQGKILDAGCGSGRDIVAFKSAGFQVTAFDASEEMVSRARKYSGLPVLHMRFQDLNWQDEFDGVWACASLLHVPESELAVVMQRAAAALKRGGVLYGSFKVGTGEVERRGRMFTDLNEEGLTALLFEVTGLSLLEAWRSNDVRPGRGDHWLNFLCMRQ